MAKKVAQITTKIVELTGNEATAAFIGRPVTQKNTKNGVVYAIGDTGYVLTSQEYKMFVAAGAIAQPTAKKTTTKKKSGADIDHIVAAEKSKVAAEKASEMSIRNEKHQRILASSSFLQNYPTPEFKMDTPKHIGLFDKGEDFGQKVTGFFDRIGRKGKDKIIESMNK